MSYLTRSSTQKILNPIKKSFSSFSSFSSSSTNNSNIKSDESSREDLILDDEIVKMYLGFEKIGLPIHGFTDIAFFLPRIFLPSRTPIISGKRWLHASLLLETKNDYSIVVEYGAYDGDDIVTKDNNNNYTAHKTYYWFEQSHGLRYAELNYYDYKYDKLAYDSYSERIFPLECGRRRTLRQVLRECNSQKKWTCANYDLACQNCQDFIAKFLDVIDGYRKEKTAYRGLHNLSSTKIPVVILNILEKNEDDAMNTVEKVPIVGPIIGAFYGIFR